MPRAVAAVEELADDGFLRERRNGQGCDEFLCGRRHDGLHLRSSFDEEADELTCFVGGDAARDAKDDMLAFHSLYGHSQNPMLSLMRVRFCFVSCVKSPCIIHA